MSRQISPYAPFAQHNDVLTISNNNIQLSAGQPSYLPGCPRVSLSRDDVERYTEQELTTPELDTYQRMHLLWLVATPSSRHVSSLTHQGVRGRQLVITEQSRLHCVWIDDRVFLKPIPLWLLSENFWRFYLEQPSASVGPLQPAHRLERIVRAAKGFMRTYALLVTHETDFQIAREKRLIPAGVSWEAFCRFISVFDEVTDDEVNLRYAYGDLRLSRLNLYAPIALGTWYYHKVYGQYANYFAQIFAPIIFVIGFWSVLLTAMQTVLAALDVETYTPGWERFGRVALWFPVATLIGLCAMGGMLIFLVMALLLRELVFAVRFLWGKRHRKQA